MGESESCGIGDSVPEDDVAGIEVAHHNRPREHRHPVEEVSGKGSVGLEVDAENLHNTSRAMKLSAAEMKVGKLNGDVEFFDGESAVENEGNSGAPSGSVFSENTESGEGGVRVRCEVGFCDT